VTRPAVRIRFDADTEVFAPGETLAGDYRIGGVRADELRAVELSVLWHTEGKGDEDLSVHEFARRSDEDGDLPEPGQPVRFETKLPLSPLSYDGAIVKIRWCVRVRVFLEAGKEVVGERRFRLGRVPPVGVSAP